MTDKLSVPVPFMQHKATQKIAGALTAHASVLLSIAPFKNFLYTCPNYMQHWTPSIFAMLVEVSGVYSNSLKPFVRLLEIICRKMMTA